jgi:hypothetical protein
VAEAPGFHEEAWQEVVEAADWYEARVPGLGDRVYEETDQALDRTADAPEAGAPWHHPGVEHEVRRVPLESFPHSLYYVVRT